MKKIIKISILVIILGLCISIKSFAASPFRLIFKDGLEVNMGETIEVPLVLDSIRIDDVAQDLNILKCRIEYDENVFELVEFKSDLKEVNQNTGRVTELVEYNDNTRAIVYPSGTKRKSITEITELGKVTLLAKDNIATGDYSIGVTDVQAGNDDGLIEVDGTETLIHVNGIDAEKQQEEEYQLELPEIEAPTAYEAEFKEVKLRIQMKKDGTEIVITPDEVNGGKVGRIVVNDEEIERTGDKYIVKTKPNTFYNILAFDMNGNNVFSDSYVTSVATESSEDQNDTNSEDTNKEDNKEDNKKDEKEDDKKQEENKTDEDKKDDNNKASNDVKKSPQTGDGVYASIILLIIATFAWIIAYGMKYVKDE